MFHQLAAILLLSSFASSTIVRMGCDVKFSDLKSSIELVICPSGCWMPGPGICGDQIYGDGSVCRSAIHAGAVADSGGFVVVYKGVFATPSGSDRYGVNSSDCFFPQQTYSFKMTCDTVGEAQFGINEVICPPGCGSGLQVCGTKVYSGSSHVCAAAVHAGNITAAVGGRVRLYRLAKQQSYVSSTKNGVTTSPNCPPSDFAFTFEPRLFCPSPTKAGGCGSNVPIVKGMSNDTTLTLLITFIGLTGLLLVAFIVAIVCCCKINRGRPKPNDKENLVMIESHLNPNATPPKNFDSDDEEQHQDVL